MVYYFSLEEQEIKYFFLSNKILLYTIPGESGLGVELNPDLPSEIGDKFKNFTL